MKKYQIVLTFLFIVFYLFGLYITYKSFEKSKEVKLNDINITVIDIKKKLSIDINKIYHSTYRLWGLEQSKILRDRIKKRIKKSRKTKNKLSKINNSKINVLKRKICIGKNCWIFMGIVGIGNQTKVTLLSTDKKPKLKTFMIGDELLKDLVIVKITEDEMIVLHKKDKKKFVLKLFEINIKKYFPKDIKEIHE